MFVSPMVSPFNRENFIGTSNHFLRCSTCWSAFCVKWSTPSRRTPGWFQGTKMGHGIAMAQNIPNCSSFRWQYAGWTGIYRIPHFRTPDWLHPSICSQNKISTPFNYGPATVGGQPWNMRNMLGLQYSLQYSIKRWRQLLQGTALGRRLWQMQTHAAFPWYNFGWVWDSKTKRWLILVDFGRRCLRTISYPKSFSPDMGLVQDHGPTSWVRFQGRPDEKPGKARVLLWGFQKQLLRWRKKRWRCHSACSGSCRLLSDEGQNFSTAAEHHLNCCWSSQSEKPSQTQSLFNKTRL